MAPLRILISNDDGVFADGIKALALAAAARGHHVTVVCPAQERSATGHGLTLQQPIRAEQADQLFGNGITAWACSGTPADCMKLALFELLDAPPDLVLSGINHGPNLHRRVLFRHGGCGHGGHPGATACHGGEQCLLPVAAI